MKYAVSGKISGAVQVPVSKSDLHRLMIASALCPGETTVISPYTLNDDISATASLLEGVGAKVVFSDNFITVTGITVPASGFVADCRESGSTLRFLTPVLSALNCRCTFTGQGRLPQRPMTPLLEQMKQHGSVFSGDLLPFELSGKLEAGIFTFPGNISSQYITGLLMALPLLSGDSKVELTSPLESVGYVNMTLSVLKQFGIRIEAVNDGWYIPGGQKYGSPGKITAEGDWSNAAFWLAAGALSGPVTVSDLALDSLQGDLAICSILEQMGAAVTYGNDSVTVAGGGLHGTVIDGSQIPDIVPILAVIAALASGETRIINAGRLRIKESDRLSAVRTCLESIGAQVAEGADSLTITGSTVLTGGAVNSYNDHRIAMCMAIASLRCKQPVVIEDPLCVKKSYPEFYQEFQRLGGAVHAIDLG